MFHHVYYLFIHLQIIAKKILKILIEYSINKYKKLCHKEIFVMKTMTEYSVILELCPIRCLCIYIYPIISHAPVLDLLKVFFFFSCATSIKKNNQ
jgi:hypothetical protein